MFNIILYVVLYVKSYFGKRPGDIQFSIATLRGGPYQGLDHAVVSGMGFSVWNPRERCGFCAGGMRTPPSLPWHKYIIAQPACGCKNIFTVLRK